MGSELCIRDSLYTLQTFIDRNPATTQALANAIVRAAQWIQRAGPLDIINTVPESYLLGDRAVYIDAFLAAKGALSPDGMPREFPQRGQQQNEQVKHPVPVSCLGRRLEAGGVFMPNFRHFPYFT